jgi:hypothetical protein
MRHLGSIVLALVLAPATWILTGVGLSKFAEARADSGGFDMDLAVGVGAVVGAGLCYALLVLPRLSPLGPVLAGLAFLGLVVWRVADLAGFDRAVPADFLDVSLALRNPAEGYAAVLAMPLLGTLFSPRRWQRHDHPPAEDTALVAPVYQTAGYAGGSAEEYPMVPGMPTAGHPPPPYQQQPYPQQPSQTGARDTDPTWQFPTDPESTRRL